MINIEFEKGAGLGNQLWLYASMRGIAKQLNKKFSITNYDNFKGKDFLLIDKGIENQDSDFRDFFEELIYDDFFNTLIANFDNSINYTSGNLKLNGIFQSEKYFFGETENLYNWITPSNKVIEKSKKYENKIILNIRGGEYKRHKDLLLPKSYWDNAIISMKKKYPKNDMIIVTDDFHYSSNLFNELDIISDDVEECYAALYGAKSLIISNSSFSYFPIKTRKDKPFVIAPINWARYNNIYNLWISPANFYSDWYYLDSNKNLKSYDDLQPELKKTILFFDENFKLKISSKNKIVKNKYYFIPKFLKNSLKAILKIINPKKF